MRSVGKERLHRRFFNHLAGVHDDDARRHFRDDAEIVRDEQQCHSRACTQFAQQLEDLGLDRDVEGRSRFVGDDQLRFEYERHCDHHALPHAAGEFVRILLGAHRRIRNANLREHCHCPSPRFLSRGLGVYAHDFRDLITDGEHWIERRHGLLENHRHAIAANGAQLFIREREQVESIKSNCAPRLNATG